MRAMAPRPTARVRPWASLAFWSQLPHRLVEVLVVLEGYAEQVLDLAGTDDQGRCGREPDEDRVGEQAGEEPEPGDTEDEVDGADEQGEEPGGGDVAGAALLGDAGEGRGAQQRDDRDGADGQLP